MVQKLELVWCEPEPFASIFKVYIERVVFI